MSRIVILGAGGTGQDALDILTAINLKSHGFLDDRAQGPISGVPVLGPLSRASSFSDVMFVNALGSPNNFAGRKKLIASLAIPAERFLTIVHPGAVISPQATLGRGLIIYPFVHIGAGSVVGDHVTILSSSVINHHCTIRDFSILASHVCLCGGVTLGESTYIGASATIRQNQKVGDGALVGMGAVVVADVPPGQVVAGNPARAVGGQISSDGLRP